MKKIINAFTFPSISCAYLYFYVHFVTEIISFFVLSKIVGNNIVLWLAPFIYDAFAFVPQSIIGYISDKYPKINFGIVGIILLTIGLITFSLNLLPGNYTELILVCLGNAFIHVEGAEVTLRASEGKLSFSAIFVSGGSFGVITGKLLGMTNISFWYLSILALTMVPFALLANFTKRDSLKNNIACEKYNYSNKLINPYIVILFTVLVVIVRGYIGYGIPTSWNKTIFETVLLYIVMGIGKCLGGILSDAFGIRKIALISVLGSLPFLIIGDNNMFISLIGIMLFSMTMPITLGVLASVLKKTPGLAFGLTTIGLFLGTVPIFFFKIINIYLNITVITILTIISFLLIIKVVREE